MAKSKGDLVLAIGNVSVYFEVKDKRNEILKNIHLDVFSGESIGIIGPSGSGKTTLAKVILGMAPPNAKIIGNLNYFPKRELPKKVGEQTEQFRKGSDVSLLAQEPWSVLNPAMSIRSQFREAISAHHPELTRKEILYKTKNLLTEVGLPLTDEKLKHYSHEFSGGEQQRICVALAILHEPKLLVADEPTSSLDAFQRETILDLLFASHKKLNTALILISHDTEEVFRRCSVVYEIKAGRLNLAKRPVVIEPSNEGPAKKLKAKSGQTVVSVKGLSFSFDKTKQIPTVFERLSFDLLEGESLGVVGESGAGKSTLARLIVGFERAQVGELEVLGKNLMSESFSKSDRSDLAMIFQDSSLSLNPKLSVEDILLEPLKSQGLNPTNRKDLIEKSLTDVGLDKTMASTYPRFLSGGQRQRVNIARALMLRPKLVIADEPASSLDVETARRVLGLIKTLQQELGFALLLISHDQKLIEQYTDRVLLIRKNNY